MKRGRPSVSVKKDTLIGVRVTPDLADELFLLAHRERTEVSTITRALWIDWLRKRGVGVSGVDDPDPTARGEQVPP